MLKRSLLSVVLVTSLACPVVKAELSAGDSLANQAPEQVGKLMDVAKAESWTDSASRLATEAIEGLHANLASASTFAKAMINPEIYKQVVEKAQNAYSKDGIQAAAQELVQDKRAVTGVAVLATVAGIIGYAVYKTYVSKKTDK